ncbi:MAG: hypothetical protein HYU74_12705 [Dechloromonas sp.]|nr:hypothetical protein [Dechloromonas sp.]
MIELTDHGFGHPWHGRYQGGVLHLPTGATRPLPGATPLGGDNYKVAIPGYPAATNTPADIAAGKTWANYAVMYGRQHCLYGKPIGAQSWIYIDPDSKPWHATLAVSAGTLTVTFKRFGVFGAAAETHTASLAITVPANSVVEIDDIDSAGRQLALVAREIMVDYYPAFDFKIPHHIWLFTIAGPVTAPTMVLIDKDTGTEINESITDTGGPIYWYKQFSTGAVTGPFNGAPESVPEGFSWAVSTATGVATFHSERAVGATLAGDVFALVKSVTHRVTVVTMTHDMGSLFNAADPALEPTGTRNFWLVRANNVTDISGYYGLSICGNLTQFPIAQKVSNVEPFGPAASINPLVVAGYTLSSDPGQVFDGFSWPFIGQRQIHETRLGNRAYAAQAYSINEQHLFLGIAGPVSNMISPLMTSNGAPYLASAHHTTGELITALGSEVCWV